MKNQDITKNLDKIKAVPSCLKRLGSKQCFSVQNAYDLQEGSAFDSFRS